MDHRWRTHHDAIYQSKPAGFASPYQGHPHFGQPIWQGASQPIPNTPPLGPPPRWLPMQAVPIRDPNAAATYHQLSQANAEIARLRSALTASRAEADRRATESERQAQSRFADERSRLVTGINELRSKVTELEQSRQTLQTEKQKSAADVQVQNELIATLKAELENVAKAASSEQQRLIENLNAAEKRREIELTENAETVSRLKSKVDRAKQSILAWSRAHSAGVQTCEWLQTRCRGLSNELAAAGGAYDQLHNEAMRLLRQRDDRIALLQDTVAGLRADHEAVELINDDLDHNNDRLQFEFDELANDLNEVVIAGQRDQQQLVQATQIVSEQLATTHFELEALSREKQSLLDTIERQEAIKDEFDATLFAKEQEINACKRTNGETQRQLDQLRREQATLAGQRDQLRCQLREQDERIADLSDKLIEAGERADRAMETIDERDCQLREARSVARAAEANTTLRIHEVEREYAKEVERLEALVERYEHDGQQHVEEFSGLKSQNLKLESELSVAMTNATASSKENDGLQQRLDQSDQQLRELQQQLKTKDERLVLNELALEELRESGGARETEINQLRRELAERKSQLANDADNMATLQHSVESLRAENQAKAREADAERTDDRDERWQKKLTEATTRLDQELIATRERYHHVSLIEQQKIATLEQQLQRSVVEGDLVSARLRETEQQCQELRQRLATFTGFENPIAEARRLSRELSRKTAEYAAEREALMRRIDRLQMSHLSRAA